MGKKRIIKKTGDKSALKSRSLARAPKKKMAVEDIISSLVVQVGSIGRWLQAIGLIVVLWIIINIANWWMNKKRMKKIESIVDDMKRIENKIDKISKKIKA